MLMQVSVLRDWEFREGWQVRRNPPAPMTRTLRRGPIFELFCFTSGLMKRYTSGCCVLHFVSEKLGKTLSLFFVCHSAVLLSPCRPDARNNRWRSPFLGKRTIAKSSLDDTPYLNGAQSCDLRRPVTYCSVRWFSMTVHFSNVFVHRSFILFLPYILAYQFTLVSYPIFCALTFFRNSACLDIFS